MPVSDLPPAELASLGWCAPTEISRLLWEGLSTNEPPYQQLDDEPITVTYTHECACCWNCCTNHPDD